MDNNGEKIWRGRGRMVPAAARVLRSPSLSSPASGSSGESVTNVSEQFAVMTVGKESTATPDSGPIRSRGRSPSGAHEGRGTHRGFRHGPTTVTKPVALMTKKGTAGMGIDLLVNYFVVKKATAWSLYQYDVEFNPVTDFVKHKKAYLRQHAEFLGRYVFDLGKQLYSSQLYKEEPLVLVSTDKEDSTKKFTITITKTRKLEPGDAEYISFYNILLRKCLQTLQLQEMGRNYFDVKAAINIPEYRLSLLPGFVTSIRNHEHDVLLCVETTHKVIRKDNVLINLEEIKKRSRTDAEYENSAKQDIVGTVVLTSYNNKTYCISDIDFSKNPSSTFDMRGTQISYAEYYEAKYRIILTDKKQPLLLTKPKTKDYHRIQGNQDPGRCYLIPELCQMTGLADAMRSNFSLMKELGKYLHQGPPGRVKAIRDFMSRLQSTKEVVDDIKSWGLEFSKDIVKCGGRTLPPESIIFASPRGEGPEKLNEKADWTMAFRSRKMLSVSQLRNWSIIVPQRDAGNVDNLVNTMQKVSGPIGFTLPRPTTVQKISTPTAASYIKAIDDLRKTQNELLFVILPSNKPEPYGSIKKKLSAEVGMISQCFVAKNMTSKGLMSIATKVVIQINAKLGGEPWSVNIPLKKMLVVGLDVYHATKNSGVRNVAAMVASYTQSHAAYYSTVSFYKTGDELSRCVCSDLMKCVQAYREMNNDLPDRILFFRDGVGDGQLEMVVRTELAQVKKALEEVYSSQKLAVAKLTYLVVTKKINTRLFAIPRRDPENPLPGTVCDDVVTLPERYDFFLVPQVARQGTVSPSAFNVIYDTQNLDPDKIQRLAFKFCHLYFNWSGTVAVPAHCQYAHKLAALTGISIGTEPSINLNYKLHFL